MKKHPLLLSIMTSFFLLSGCDNTTNSTDNEQVSTEAEAAEQCVQPDVQGYIEVGCLHDGLAGVVKLVEGEYGETPKIGYINESGEVIIPIIYDGIPSGEGGDVETFSDFSEGLVTVYKDGMYGYLNAKGEVVIPFTYDWANKFSEGLATVIVDGKWGAIDKEGNTVVPFEYDMLSNFNNGLATAMRASDDPEDMSSNYGVIDKNNNIVIPFIYKELGEFSEGLIAAKKNEKWGYIDKDNNQVIPINLDYPQVGNFSDGLAVVYGFADEYRDSFKYGYIDKTGELVIPIQYDLPTWGSEEGTLDFKNGVAVITDAEGNLSCIDKTGNTTACPDGRLPKESAMSEQAPDEGYFEDDSSATAVANSNEQDQQTAPFSKLTNYLALKPNSKWSWQALAKAPEVGEWHTKKPSLNEYISDSSLYTIVGGLGELGSFTAYGTKAQPSLIVIHSAQGVMEDETGSGVYTLEDLFNTSELTPVRSSCDSDDLITQKFYQWNKPESQPLYISYTRDVANAGTSSDIAIAESFQEFFDPQYDEAFLLLDNSVGDTGCRFDLAG